MNTLFKQSTQPKKILLNQERASTQDAIMCSSELQDNIADIEPEVFETFKQRSKLAIIKITNNDQKDVLIGTLHGFGFVKETKHLTVELNVEQLQAINFVKSYADGMIKLFGIDMQNNDKTLEILPESNKEYNLLSCNVYDVVIQNDDCVLVIVVST